MAMVLFHQDIVQLPRNHDYHCRSLLVALELVICDTRAQEGYSRGQQGTCSEGSRGARLATEVWWTSIEPIYISHSSVGYVNACP
jgi:hypothetical protein